MSATRFVYCEQTIKNLFQVHGADAQGRPVLKRKLAREKVREFFADLPPRLVGLEACAAAHYWARELAKLGHEVRLMPPQYVRPYVKTNKHDAADVCIVEQEIVGPSRYEIGQRSLTCQPGDLLILSPRPASRRRGRASGRRGTG